MTRIVIVGCGIIGATLAYELSQQPDFNITVLDRQLPAQGATGAALGVLMGVISHKVKGRNWRLREISLQRYATLLPQLETTVKHHIPHNTQGILNLCFAAEELPRWQSLQAIRQGQGWPLEIWAPQQVTGACPHLKASSIVAGIYSPCDLQIDPKALTHTLVEAAQQQGVTFHFDAAVKDFQQQAERVISVQTNQTDYPADWTILTAGLGSRLLLRELNHSLPLMPVLGQGIRLRLPKPLGSLTFQPVINGNDIHLVPMGNGEYAVAATVEFPEAHEEGTMDAPLPQKAALDHLWQGVIAYCPALAQAEILETWYGLRPRPQGQAAPVVKLLANYTNVIVATGHYRNGVLLAPATAQLVKEIVIEK